MMLHRFTRGGKSSLFNEGRDGEQNPIHAAAHKQGRLVCETHGASFKGKSKCAECMFNVTHGHKHTHRTLDAVIQWLVDVSVLMQLDVEVIRLSRVKCAGIVCTH